MNPKVSIIIPVWNAELYLRQCLDSVQEQTLREIEIVCINDGSCDASGTILDEYAAKDSRFVVIHQENQGAGASRNHALKLARGEYIAFLDSDDWIAPAFCEKMYQKARETEADIVTAFPHVLENSYKSLLPLDTFSPKDRISLEDRLEVIQLAIEVWNHLWKTDFIRKSELYFSEKHTPEDILFTISGFILAQKNVFLTERNYYYRYVENSYAKNIRYFRGIAYVYAEIEDLLKKNGQELTKPILQKKWIHLYETYQYHFLQAETELRKEFEESIRQTLSEEDLHFWKKSRKMMPKEVQYFYFTTFHLYKWYSVTLWPIQINYYLKKAPWNQRFKKFTRNIKNRLRGKTS